MDTQDEQTRKDVAAILKARANKQPGQTDAEVDANYWLEQLPKPVTEVVLVEPETQVARVMVPQGVISRGQVSRVDRLMAEGLTRAEALREARYERAEQQRAYNFERRNTQANMRLGLSTLRFVKSFFK